MSNLTKQHKLRNIAIIAHVDHGKTTLVDAMLKQTGTFEAHQQIKDRVLDSNDLERERGITIIAKHAALHWRDYHINIIDTPGHSDFGGEVQRTLSMADGALLLVDAAEGALPQTRFVLSKAIELKMKIIVVINKIDRKDADPQHTLNEIFDLFCDLGASDEQANFKTIYAIGKEGIAKRNAEDESADLVPLFETITTEIPPPSQDIHAPLQFLVHNTIHDEYLGRLAVGRVWAGQIKQQQKVTLIDEQKHQTQHEITSIWKFEALGKVKIESALAGDILALGGMTDVKIGDTICDPKHPVALKRISVDEPTIKICFQVNTSSFSGKDGRFLTSRHLRERLFKEALINLSIRVEETNSAEIFDVYGRGELSLCILAETMRREGFELALGKPQVVIKTIQGQKHEPWESLVIDTPEEHIGAITQILGERKAHMISMNPTGQGRTRIEYEAPARALIGFRSLFLTITRGCGLLNTLFSRWKLYIPTMIHRDKGAIICDRLGHTTPYALFNLKPRGQLFIGPGEEVYEGQIIGENARHHDLNVNPTKEKKLTNIRAAGKDDNVMLAPYKKHTIESALEWIENDELVEITPHHIRLRKKVLQSNQRSKKKDEPA